MSNLHNRQEVVDLVKQCQASPTVLHHQLLKGDSPGHPFRGNQHVDGNSAGEINPQSSEEVPIDQERAGIRRAVQALKKEGFRHDPYHPQAGNPRSGARATFKKEGTNESASVRVGYSPKMDKAIISIHRGSFK